MAPAADEHDEDDGRLDDDPLGADDRPLGGPPDRLDRIWVHPSELHPLPRRTRIRLRTRSLLLPAVAGIVGALATVGVLWALGTFDREDDDPTPEQVQQQAAAQDAAVAQLVDAVAPGVVTVTVADENGARRASGVVIRHAGEVLTSARVVGDALSATITTQTGESMTATVIGRDPTTDLALLATEAPLQAVPLAETTLRTGDSVWIVGAHPPGVITPWISDGVVSSTDSLVARLEGPTTSGLLETDAVATTWSAGGALIDRSGAVAGIVLAPVAEARSTFVVPIALAIEIADALRTSGWVAHGALGVEGTDTPAGPTVTEVPPDSVAALAGVLPGDVVVSIDGRSVLNMAELMATVRSYAPGEIVELELLRAGEPTLVEMPLAGTPPPEPPTTTVPEAAP